MSGSDDITRLRLAMSDRIRLLDEIAEWRAMMPRMALVCSERISRTDISPRQLFVVPAGSEVHMLVVHGESGSNAGSSAEIDVGRAENPQAFVSGHSVLGPAGVGQRAPQARRLGLVTQADVPVLGRYREAGTPSTSGGPWTVTVLYSRAGG